MHLAFNGSHLSTKQIHLDTSFGKALFSFFNAYLIFPSNDLARKSSKEYYFSYAMNNERGKLRAWSTFRVQSISDIDQQKPHELPFDVKIELRAP